VVAEIGSFVALGDSFTEGMGDPGADGICLRGWADRLAERLAADRPALRYANLAIRGKRLEEVASGQLPAAIAMRPDLVSIFAGGNDLLWVRSDPDALASEFDAAVARLRQTGCQVLAFTGLDPQAFPILRLIRGKVVAFNTHVRMIAAQRGCLLVDLWSMSMLTDPRAWSADRLHLTADGHRRVALLAAEVLGLPVDEDWREPLPIPPASGGTWRSGPASWLTARASDARWARDHAAPWLIRRLRGVSAGDGIPPKRPQLIPVLAQPAALAGQAALVAQSAGAAALNAGAAALNAGEAALNAVGIATEGVSQTTEIPARAAAGAGETAADAGDAVVSTVTEEAVDSAGAVRVGISS
jgi:lysophospholipase L1-like esterase